MLDEQGKDHFDNMIIPKDGIKKNKEGCKSEPQTNSVPQACCEKKKILLLSVSKRMSGNEAKRKRRA
ncbi:MAG: hypothetical protein GY820_11330 [Gammaproteobacteria bacterium]|nr:hypothetical protein [Gammaproteobacteria bacterium]